MDGRGGKAPLKPRAQNIVQAHEPVSEEKAAAVHVDDRRKRPRALFFPKQGQRPRR